MRVLPHVIGMFLLGAVALIGAGVLHVVRANQWPQGIAARTETPRGTSGTGGRPSSGPEDDLVERAASDLADSLRGAADAFEAGQRMLAVVTLDGAHRVSDVLNHTVDNSGPLGAAFQVVNAARTALADGDPRTAAVLARTAAALAQSAIAEGAQPPPDPRAYLGALAFRATGERLGRIVGSDSDAMAVESGGLSDVLGFLALSHGARRRIAIGQILFGERRRVGNTMVVAVE